MLLKTKSPFKLKILAIIMGLFLAVHSCQESTPPSNQSLPTQRDVNRSMEDINRQMALEEDAVIEGYAERRGWEMTKTGTGLRYMIYDSSGEGDKAREGQVATLKYKVSLMDGEEVYSSENDGPRSFMIGQDNVESGLHEAVTYLKLGDKAQIILPSHLAHGLTGDNNKIPPRSTVIYDLELIGLK
mgnify:CR=1 FL=1